MYFVSCLFSRYFAISLSATVSIYIVSYKWHNCHRTSINVTTGISD